MYFKVLSCGCYGRVGAMKLVGAMKCRVGVMNCRVGAMKCRVGAMKCRVGVMVCWGLLCAC